MTKKEILERLNCNCNKALFTVISGSFRKHLKQICLLKNELEKFPIWFHAQVIELGQIFNFFSHSLRLAFQSPYRITEFLKHMEFIGNKSIGIIMLTGFFTGMVLTFQIYLGLKKKSIEYQV